MKYLEFDSLYKFIISVGIIFILSPFVIFYILFNKNINLLINKEEFNKLTQTSQEIVNMKQQLFLKLIDKPVLYIVICGIVGFLLVGYGVWRWHEVQKQLDLKPYLENTKIKTGNWYFNR